MNNLCYSSEKEITIKIPTCCSTISQYVSDFNVLEYDFTKPEEIREAEFKNQISEMIKNNTFLDKPLGMVYKWKSVYEGDIYPTLKHFFWADVDVTYSNEKFTYILNFSSPKEVVAVDSEDNQKHAYNIKTYVVVSDNHVDGCFNYVTRFYKSEIFMLHENGDGQINTVDESLSRQLNNNNTWSSFKVELDKNEKPALFLKTNLSERITPASYEFTRTSDNKYIGFIEIHYLKEVDGQKELWIERREFTEELPFIGFNSIYANVAELVTAKIPLV